MSHVCIALVGEAGLLGLRHSAGQSWLWHLEHMASSHSTGDDEDKIVLVS